MYPQLTLVTWRAGGGHVPVLGGEGRVDGVEGDDLLEEVKHGVAIGSVGEVCERGVASEVEVSKVRWGKGGRERTART